MSERIIHDSLSPDWRSPFGAVRETDCVNIRIGVPLSCPAVGASLEVRRDDGFSLSLPLDPEREERGCAVFGGRLGFFGPGLYFYHFIIKKPDGSFRLFRLGLSDTNIEEGEEWQITVYSRDYSIPERFRGAVMYQIFPDRFAIGGEVLTEGKLEPFRVHKSTSEQPDRQPDPDGNWNADFFGGNFRGITEKLDYIKDLGVEVVYLNPIFKAQSSHRYDTADYLLPDPMLGTEEDFACLCREAEKRGIAIILDGVFSHTGSVSAYFKDAASRPDSPYRSWYKWKSYPDKYECWWNVRSLPCVDETCPSYLDFIVRGKGSVLEKWTRLGASGFRLDVADELPDAFISEFRRRLKEEKPDGLLIGEVWEDASNKISYGERRKYFTGGELDGVMNYPFRCAMLGFASGRISAADFRESVMRIVENYPRDALLCSTVFLSTHDTPRILTALEECGKGLEGLELAVKIAAFLPGIFCVYYGDESGMKGGKDPYNHGFFREPEKDSRVYRIWRECIGLRKAHPALRTGDVEIEARDGRLSITRSLGDDTVRLTVCGAEARIECLG